MSQIQPAPVVPSTRQETTPSGPAPVPASRQGLAAARPGRPEAAAAIWAWRTATAAAAPDAGSLRRRGAIKALIPAVIGVLLYRNVSTLGGSIVLGIAGVVLLSALLSPTRVYAVLERAFDALATRFAQLVNWVVLRALFFAVFWPFGKALRTGSKDRLQRFHDAARQSYWSDRTGERVASRKRGKQF